VLAHLTDSSRFVRSADASFSIAARQLHFFVPVNKDEAPYQRVRETRMEIGLLVAIVTAALL
jgi:hypothetical protein